MQKCATCNFYDRRSARNVDGRTARSGQCRHSAPMLSPLTTKTYQIEGVWPTVRDDDWCGEWKILARRPSSLPVPAGAGAAVASVTSLVAAASATPRVAHEAVEPMAMAAD